MIDTALAATEGDGSVDFALTVTNAGDDPITLRFRSGQRADFAAYAVSDAEADTDSDAEADTDSGGEADTDSGGDACEDPSPVSDDDPVWRHGADRMFTQALGTETLEPGESATYKGRWDDPPAGTYRIVGTVTADDGEPTATATVTV